MMKFALGVYVGIVWFFLVINVAFIVEERRLWSCFQNELNKTSEVKVLEVNMDRCQQDYDSFSYEATKVLFSLKTYARKFLPNLKVTR